jgi:hypothetical protein
MPRIPLVYKKGTYSQESGEGKVVIVSGGPYHRRSYIRSALLFDIASSTEEILIATLNFSRFPCDQVTPTGCLTRG